MAQARITRNIMLGIENLLLHKLRSFLTTLGVVFGVGSVVAMLSVGEGASKEALDQIRKVGSNNIIIRSMKSVEEESQSTTHSHMSIYGLTYDDERRMRETFHDVSQVVPVKLVRKDGSWFHANAAVTRFILDHSEVALFSAIDISPRKKAETDQRKTLELLEEKQTTLQHKNVALAELIDQIEIEKSLLKDQISTNIREVIYPILERMKSTGVENQYLDLIKRSIDDIAGRFGIELSEMAPRLSPRELEITTLIHSGLTSKQIATFLGLSYETVEKHRRNIRKKIGITGKKINLASYLQVDPPDIPHSS